jgi:hypothetical protein
MFGSELVQSFACVDDVFEIIYSPQVLIKRLSAAVRNPILTNHAM